MKAVVELTQEEHKQYSVQLRNLQEKLSGLPLSERFEKLDTRTGYAHYSFDGTMSEALIKALGRAPTSEELIMIVDGGFSHFGASCSISGMQFSGRVNTD